MKAFIKKSVKILFAIFGSALIFDALLMTVFSNFNVGIILTFMLGALLILFAVFAAKLTSKLWKILKHIFIIGVVVVLAFQSFLFIYGTNDTINTTEDAIIVLGSGIRGERLSRGLQNRLDRAVECYNQNSNLLIIVSGGQGEQETITEALAMERYLLKQGVPQTSIIKEEKATSTYENFKFCKEILDERMEGDYTMAFVSNDYHIYRAGSLAKLAGFENITHAHTNTKWYTAFPSSVRECLAVIKLWIFKN